MAVDLSKYIKNIRIDTAYLPPIIVSDPFGAGDANPFVKFLKPRITVDVAGMGEKSYAPYGEPGETLWPVIQLSLIALGVAFVANKFLHK